MTWLLSNWKPLLVVLIIAAVGIGCWHHGVTTTDAAWQAKWEKREADAAAATSKEQREQRTIEQSRQHSVDKVTQDAQRKIDRAQDDAIAARAAADGLRDAAAKLAARLAASEAGRDSCTAAAGQAAAQHARVLADMLGEADRLAGIYAEAADESRVRGLACEASYDSVRGE